jgi:hypothetical protein
MRQETGESNYEVLINYNCQKHKSKCNLESMEKGMKIGEEEADMIACTDKRWVFNN